VEPLIYVDPSGNERRFYYSLDEISDGRGTALDILVWPTPEIELGTAPYYHGRFAREGEGMLRSDMLENYDNDGAKRIGLSEAVFELIQKMSRCTIVSSQGLHRGTDEWQSMYGRNMWLRFQNKGLASYDTAADRFTYIPPTKSA
jgi:hypothetical protein